MGWIFVVLAVIIVHLAVVRWKEGKDKPIEFDTPILKARREKFKKSVKEILRTFLWGTETRVGPVRVTNMQFQLLTFVRLKLHSILVQPIPSRFLTMVGSGG